MQGHKKDVFLNGLHPLSLGTSEISTIDSTPREHAQHGLRGKRIGETDETDEPGPVMKALVRAFSGAQDVVL